MPTLGQGDSVAPEALEEGLAALAELDSVEDAKSMAEAFHKEAHDSLNRLEVDPALRALREFTGFQLGRLH